MKHKYSNTPAGYDLVGNNEPWYRRHNFPLVPMFETSKGDAYNAPSFVFSWLFLRAWSLEHLQLEFGVEMDTTGVNIKIILPYLRVVLRVIPLPWDFVSRFNRTPKGVSNDKEM